MKIILRFFLLSSLSFFLVKPNCGTSSLNGHCCSYGPCVNCSLIGCYYCQDRPPCSKCMSWLGYNSTTDGQCISPCASISNCSLCYNATCEIGFALNAEKTLCSTPNIYVKNAVLTTQGTSAPKISVVCSEFAEKVFFVYGIGNNIDSLDIVTLVSSLYRWGGGLYIRSTYDSDLNVLSAESSDDLLDFTFANFFSYNRSHL